MSRRFALILCLALPMAGTARLSAHDPLRFNGAVVKMDVAKGVLTIYTIDDGQATKLDITFDEKTIVMQAGKKVARSALKPGLHVIVDALGCIDEVKIEGVSVEIVPPGHAASPVRTPAAAARERGTEIPKGDPVPTVALRVDGPGRSGWSFSVVTPLVMTMAMGTYQPMRGHVHIYVDGTANLMITDKQFTLNIAPGKHTVRVLLSGMDHFPLLHDGKPIEASRDIIVPPAGR